MSVNFYTKLTRIFNSGQSRSVMLHGNIYDLFWQDQNHVPLLPFLLHKTAPAKAIQVVYELNGPIRILGDGNYRKMIDAWVKWREHLDGPANIATQTYANLNSITKGEPISSGNVANRFRIQFTKYIEDSVSNATQALEFMRQLCMCSRWHGDLHLIIFIEAADMLLPVGNGSLATLTEAQLRRIAIVQDWFGEPGFASGSDSVVLISESPHLIHPRISRLPQVLDVEVPSPNEEERKHFITISDQMLDGDDASRLARLTAGLSLYALRQLLLAASYEQRPLSEKDVLAKVEEFIQKQLGEDVVEFKKPHHGFDDVVGATDLKQFLQHTLIPRIQSREHAPSGAAVAGPIGSGKTFIFEAMAASLEMPVLVLKNIRSQWFGQTDVIFERLRRVLEALGQVVIFVDEADTQFGSVGSDAHETERRLTGKIQAMMSDTRLKGRVFWLLMTARIHLLSPDIRRPGRAGDIIIPVLDAQKDDRLAFIRWATLNRFDDATIQELYEILPDSYSAASYSVLRSEIKAADAKDRSQLLSIVNDIVPPSIEQVRRYQTLQAMINCTRISLLPATFSKCSPRELEEKRKGWSAEIKALEFNGIK